MSETQCLLERITALRQEPSYAAPPSSSHVAAPPSGRLASLRKQVTSGSRQDLVTDHLVRQAGGTHRTGTEAAPLPRQLTSRMRRLLDRGRALVNDLRGLAEEPLLRQEGHPLGLRYAETAAMADVALRLLQTFPELPSEQLHLCRGLDGILRTIDERVTGLLAAVTRHRQERELVYTLAEMLRRVHHEQPVELDSFALLAETLVNETRNAAPLRFLDPEGDDPAGWVAAHSLTTARVVARLAWRHPEFGPRAAESVLAALVCDVGMLGVPAAFLTQSGPLEPGARRQVELHTLHGRDLVRECVPGAPTWLSEVVATHHERLDGTGYPAGLLGTQVPSLTRFLAVCDVYTALVCARPFRPARGPRGALTETLALAQRGLLDATYAAELMELSFYPTGTAVELADGSVGVVVGTHSRRQEAASPARPVVALLLDDAEQPVRGQHVLDLEQVEGRAVVRALSGEECRARLGPWFAEWAT